MFRIFGPPGTGKTTTLLNMVDKAMEEGISPNQIGFFAFTKKAANEAKERATKRFNLNPEKDLPYFRTIHSLAYRMLSVKEHQMMSGEHYRALSERIGFQLTASTSDEESTAFKPTDHPILALINLAKAKKQSLHRTYNQSDINFTWTEVQYVADAYQNYKEAFGLIDFTDMLQKFIDEAHVFLPNFKLVFLDEAQDLSPLQWDIAHKLDEYSEKMYCAGDDDQAIYRWAGADVDHFINLPGGAEVLEQSYRVPKAIHNVASRISNRIKNRFPKVYRPREEEGNVFRTYDISSIDMSKETWLIMAQANYMLYPIEQALKSNGYLYEKQNSGRSIGEKMSIAINGWESLRKGRAVPTGIAQCIYGYMSGNGNKIKRGHKNIKAPDEALLTMQDLKDNFGLLADESMIWHEAMDKIPEGDRAYITALLRRGEKFNAQPRIRLSTIHGTKGGEAENAVLLTDLTAAAMDQSGDDLHRVFYVGVTRASKNLYIVEPEDYMRAYDL